MPVYSLGAASKAIYSGGSRLSVQLLIARLSQNDRANRSCSAKAEQERLARVKSAYAKLERRSLLENTVKLAVAKLCEMGRVGLCRA